MSQQTLFGDMPSPEKKKSGVSQEERTERKKTKARDRWENHAQARREKLRQMDRGYGLGLLETEDQYCPGPDKDEKILVRRAKSRLNKRQKLSYGC